MESKEEHKLRELKHQIVDILEAYTPCIGGVPLQMLEYHLRKPIYENSRGEIVRDKEGQIMVDSRRIVEYTQDELGLCLRELLHDKRISRDVVAYKMVESKKSKPAVVIRV